MRASSADADPPVHLVGRGARDRRQQHGIDPAPDDGGFAQDVERIVVDLVEPGVEDVAERRRQRPAALEREQLLDMEGVAVGQRDDARRRCRIGPVAEDPGDLAPDIGLLERGQADVIDGPGALELGEDRCQRVSAMQLVRAECEQQDRAGAREAAGEEGDDVECRSVGPVEVVDGQDEIRRRRGADHEVPQALDPRRSAGRLLA